MTNGAAVPATLTLAPSGGTATFSGSIGDGTGGVSLTINGTGTQILAGANTYSGATTILAGTLNLSNQYAVQNSTLTMAGGALTLDQSVAGHAFTIGGLSGSGNIALQDNAVTPDPVALTVGGNNASTTFTGALAGLGSLTKGGNGVLTLTGTNTYSGATVISAGTLQLNGVPTPVVAFNFNSSSGTTVNNAGLLSSAYNATLTNGATIVPGVGLNGGNALSTGTAQGVLLMNQNVSLASGNWTASAWFYGLYNNSSGYESLFGNPGGADHQIIVAGGGLGSWLSTAGNMNYSGTGMTSYYGQQAWNQVAAVASGGTTAFYIDGNFVGSIANASTSNIYAIGNFLTNGGQAFAEYLDDVYIYQSALTAAQVKSLYALSPNNLNVLPALTPVQIASGATLDLNGASQQVASLNDYVSGSQGTVTNSAAVPATLTLAPTGGTATFSGSIGDGSGGVSLAINGSGTQVLKGANTFSGATTVSAGTLNLSNQNALQNSTLTMAGGALTLDQSVAGHAFTIGGLSGAGSIALQDNAVTPDPVVLTVGGNNASTTFTGALSGLGSLTKSGSGVLALGGPSTYSGPTAVTAGTLKLLAAGFLDPTNATAESWYNPRLPGNTINGSGMTPNNPVTPTSTCSTVASNMWLSNGDTATWIAFDLGSVQTITGFHLWNYNEGNSSSQFWGRGVEDATMYVGTTMPVNNASYGSQGPAWGASAGTFAFAEATGAGYTGNDYTFSAPVTTQYIELYVGSNFGTSDNYTGISQIRFETNSNLPGGSPVQLATGATLDLNGASQQVASLNDYVSGSQGTVTNSATTNAILTLVANDGSTATFGGTIADGAGTVALVKSGNFTQILAGSNTYSGGTTISSGTLQIGNGTSGEYLASPTISNSGALVFDHADTLTYAGAISGSGQLTEQGGGMLILSGNNNYTGPTTVAGGTLQIGNGTSGEALASPSIAMSNNATVVFNHADPLPYSGTISGSGQLVKTGSGLLTLNGASTYSGPTTISAGTLDLGDNNRLPTATALTIASGGAFDLAGNVQTVGSLSGPAGAIVTNSLPLYPSTLTVAPSSGSTTFAGNIIGNDALALSGSGELTLSGTNTYTGGTTVSGGTLDIAVPSALSGSGLVTIAAGGRLVLGSGAGIGALLAASPPADSGAVALSGAASAPATICGYENASGSMATLGGAPPLSQGGGGSAVSGTAAAVPEPGTIALLAAGAVAAAALRRKRKCC